MRRRGHFRSPELLLEAHLIKLESMNRAQLHFWESYWIYLAQQREKRIDEIKFALLESTQRNVKLDGLCRIVGARYSDNPLSTVGSVVRPPGGRFNIGSISSSLKDMYCLYLASDFSTAFAEKYKYEYGANVGQDTTPEQMAAVRTGSFIQCECEISLDSVLDLRDVDSIKMFSDVIAEIKPREDLQEAAKKLGIGKIGTASNPVSLMKTILAEDYEQWGTIIEQPSNSQWIGHYASEAGIAGIIYPSVRSRSGFNVATFIDNFYESDNYIRISSPFAHLSTDRSTIDQKNYPFFKTNNTGDPSKPH